MLVFLPDVNRCQPTDANLIRMTSSTSSIKININAPKLFVRFVVSVLQTKAILAVLVPLRHDADAVYSVVLMWRQRARDAVRIEVLVSL